MHHCNFIIENVDRPNIRYTVLSLTCSFSEAFAWLIAIIREQQQKTPRMLVFCTSKKQCIKMYELCKNELGDDHMYCIKDDEEKDDRTALIGMYHHGTREEQRVTAQQAFTSEDSIMRLLFCTSSFGMGVNVRNCHTVINLGAPQLMDEYLQQSGRAGRDGQPSHSILVLYKGHGAGLMIEKEMKGYISNSEVCRRTVLLDAIQNTKVAPLAIPHTCCDVCARKCNCLCTCTKPVSDPCPCTVRCVGADVFQPYAEKCIDAANADAKTHSLTNQPIVLEITQDDQDIFQSELQSIKDSLIQQDSIHAIVQRAIITGFSDQLISSLVENLKYISSVKLLLDYFPFFCTEHATLVYDAAMKCFADKLIMASDQAECLCDIESPSDDSSTELENWEDYTKPMLNFSDDCDSD